jgi:hypothetical protein
VSRIGRWLREPIRVKAADVDWREFGRSFGRYAGGYLDSGEKNTPSARAWDQGANRGAERPRWLLILIGVMVVVIPVGAFWFVSTIPDF